MTEDKNFHPCAWKKEQWDLPRKKIHSLLSFKRASKTKEKRKFPVNDRKKAKKEKRIFPVKDQKKTKKKKRKIPGQGSEESKKKKKFHIKDRKKTKERSSDQIISEQYRIITSK